MKLKDLVHLTAEMTGLSEPTVSETARSLQKAGLIKTGKPGRYGGARMDENDAAALAVALLAAGERREVVTAHEVVRHLSEMIPYAAYMRESGKAEKILYKDDAAVLYGLKKSHNLFDLIVSLIRSPQPKIKGFLGLDLEFEFPNEKATFSFAVGIDGGVPRSEEIGPRRITRVIYLHPSFWTDAHQKAIAATSQPFYSVTRKLRDLFFARLAAALAEDAD